MSHTYLIFDFAENEDAAQHARHKLEGWKQAFRLDKKLLFKFERAEAAKAEAAAAAKPEKGKAGEKSKSGEAATEAGGLAFSCASISPTMKNSRSSAGSNASPPMTISKMLPRRPFAPAMPTSRRPPNCSIRWTNPPGLVPIQGDELRAALSLFRAQPRQFDIMGRLLGNRPHLF